MSVGNTGRWTVDELVHYIGISTIVAASIYKLGRGDSPSYSHKLNWLWIIDDN